MKSTLLRTFFEWALITSVLMSCGFFTWFFIKSRAARSANVQMVNAEAAIQSNRAVMSVLLSECREYAKTNADMARLLDPTRPQPAAAPAAPAPTIKPKMK